MLGLDGPVAARSFPTSHAAIRLSANHLVDRFQPPCTLVDRIQPACTLVDSCLLKGSRSMRYREFGVSSLSDLSGIMTPGMYTARDGACAIDNLAAVPLNQIEIACSSRLLMACLMYVDTVALHVKANHSTRSP